ncbi:hypothetical protein ACIBG8_28485 [Nonomuraea sp. NPDC050556]|uniref:hypothetical protein n=1 Tax=Nonomuraea sp. NPDC050556 TaxID=3364369 RepID=UPI0037ADEB04
MGRHRSDPKSIARLALIGLAVVALLVVGAIALLNRAETPPPEKPVASPSSSQMPMPTVKVVCEADVCPHVVLRVPGGQVLYNGDMALGDEIRYFEPEIDVVIEDAGTVQVTENGTARPPGKPGERADFTVRAPGRQG